jgi:HK97 family phage major capsid protein
LIKIMEALEAIECAQRDIGKKTGEAAEAQTAEINSVKNSLQELRAQCDALDKRLPKGSKIYEAPTRAQTSGLYKFGRCITEAWRLREYGKVSDDFAELQRDLSGGGGQKETSGSATGDVLVPTIIYPEVARLIGEASIIRKIATILPMNTLTMKLPVKGSGPTVSWPNEGIAPSQTSVVFSDKTLTAKTMMALTEITSELTEDSVVALEPMLAKLFAEAVAQEENQKAFSAVTIFTGVGTDTNVTKVYFGNSISSGSRAFTDVTHADMVRLQFAVDSKVVDKGAFVLASGAFQHLVAMKDTTNRPMYMTSWSALPGYPNAADLVAGTPTSIMGRPAYLTDTMPGTTSNAQLFAIYGDWSKFVFGDRRELRIDWSDQVFFEAGNLALRVRERIGMVTVIPSAFARLLTAH